LSKLSASYYLLKIKNIRIFISGKFSWKKTILGKNNTYTHPHFSGNKNGKSKPSGNKIKYKTISGRNIMNRVN